MKLQYSEDASNETYLGLTDTDYKSNPYRRYLGSNEDNLLTDHFQLMATHYIRPSQNLTFTTKGYRNTFARNWYKLDEVNLGTGSVSIANVTADPIKYAAEYAALTGNTNTIANALLLAWKIKGWLFLRVTIFIQPAPTALCLSSSTAIFFI